MGVRRGEDSHGRRGPTRKNRASAIRAPVALLAPVGIFPHTQMPPASDTSEPTRRISESGTQRPPEDRHAPCAREDG